MPSDTSRISIHHSSLSAWTATSTVGHATGAGSSRVAPLSHNGPSPAFGACMAATRQVLRGSTFST
jgi:hypothetical protein